MGQVPLIIGNGRLARHLSHWLALEGVEHRSWSRAESGGRTMGEAAREASTILLAVTDSAIAGIATELRGNLPSARIHHFSGALHLAEVPGLHPLMTFGPDFYELEAYRAIHWVCDPGHSLQAIFPTLRNPSHELNPSQRPFYHALCVLSGNLPQLLWRKAWRDLPAELGIPAEALVPYFARSLANFLANPDAALTGPLARGDRGTIALNLAALEGDPYQSVYESFVTLMERAAAPDRRAT